MEEVKNVGNVRVYEIAKEVGVTNKVLVAKIQSLGIVIKNHMSSLDLDDVSRVKRALEKERQENLVEERISATVIRRRSKGTPRVIPAPQLAPEAPPIEAAPLPVSPVAAVAAPAGEEPAFAPEAPPAPEIETPETPAAEESSVELQKVNTGELEAPPVAPTESSAEGLASAPGSPAPQPDAPTAPVAPAAPAAPVAKAAPTGRGPAATAISVTPKRPQLTPATERVVRPTGQGPANQPVVHRYAPGFKPGMQYGPKARAPRPGPGTSPGVNPADQTISAADAMKMMAPNKPKVVITDLDGRRPGSRREVVTRKELFGGPRYKGGKRRKKVMSNRKGKKTEITTPAQHKRVIRLQDAITVGEIAKQMGIKSTQVLKHLWAMGMTNVNINQAIDADTASLMATEFGYEVENVGFSEDQVLSQVDDTPEDLVTRPPVVTVMGHVDHGKTSLLDAIRKTTVANGEAGGITQHIGASKVKTAGGELVFLDTPGHEAFTQMRARGAQCTDMVVLVVAADDGVMPQTVEAVDHAKDAGVPIIVAVNKIDRPDSNPDRVRNELSERGLIPEEWGGETLFVNVSAKTGEGLEILQESLHLQAELLELAANPEKSAVGTIIESKLDKARGAMCTVLVQEGTLRVGDTVVTGEHMGKVRAMLDDHGRQVKEAGPSTPVELLGLGGVPMAGDSLNAVADEKAARTLAEYRHNETRSSSMAGASARQTYEEILGQIRSGEACEVKLLLKADVHGSSEAVRESLIKLGTAKVSVNVISAGVGGVNETDVNLANAAGAMIAGFNVRATGKAAQLAERSGVDIRIYDVIYEMLDEVKVLMRGKLPKEHREKAQGRAEVRETFVIPKVGTIAGCAMQEGKITRSSQLRLVRNNVKIFDGRVASLRRFKEDVKEVLQGYECGIGIDGCKDVQVGDVIEAYEVEEIAPEL